MDNNTYNEKNITNPYYINKISQLLEQIDQYEQIITQDKRQILNLNERIHSLYKQIANELTPQEKEHQKKIMNKLKKHKTKMIITKRTVNEEYKIINITTLNKKHYYAFKHYLELRQIHLNKILKRIGFLTTKNKKSLY